MPKVVVIGGNGFIGSHLVDAFTKLDHEVTAFDRFSSRDFTYTSGDVRYLQGDFLNRADLAKAVKGQDIVIHALSITTPATAEKDPSLDIRTNIAQSVELFETAVNAGVSNLYFASTGGAIYGNQGKSSYSETDRTMPVSPYAIGKLAVENYLEYFKNAFGLSSTIFRISNPYGPRQKINRKQGLIPIALREALKGKPVIQYGDGSMVRDFIYIDDLIRMITTIVETPHQHRLYNLGSGEGYSVSQILAEISQVLQLSLEIDERPQPPTFVNRVVLDTSRYVEEFGIPDLTALNAGIEKTAAEIRNQLS